MDKYDRIEKKNTRKGNVPAVAVQEDRREEHLLIGSEPEENEVGEVKAHLTKDVSSVMGSLSLVEVLSEPRLLHDRFISDSAQFFDTSLTLDLLAGSRHTESPGYKNLMVDVVATPAFELEASKTVREIIRRRADSLSTSVNGLLQRCLPQYSSVAVHESIGIIDRVGATALVSGLLSSLKEQLDKIRPEVPDALLLSKSPGFDALSSTKNHWVIQFDSLPSPALSNIDSRLFMEEIFMDPLLRLYELSLKQSGGVPLLESVLGATNRECYEVSPSKESSESACEYLGRVILPRSASQFSGDVPIVVLYDDSGLWSCLVAYVLLRILREVGGGSASVEVWSPFVGGGRNRKSEYSSFVNSITNLNLQNAPYRGRVNVFYLGPAGPNDGSRKRAEEFVNLMKNVLTSLYSKGPGFVLISTASREEFSYLCSDLTSETAYGLSRLICLNPSTIRRAMSEDNGTGSVPLPEEVLSEYLILGTRMEKPNTLKPVQGQQLCSQTRPASVFRNKVLDWLKPILSPFVKPQITGEGEYDRHQYPLKLLVFKAVVDRLLRTNNAGVREDASEEDELRRFIRRVRRLFDEGKLGVEGFPWSVAEQGVIPDIAFVDSGKRKVCVEIETLIGTGEPMKKVDATIQKYVGRGICDEIWVVMEPVTAAIHYEELMYRLRYRDIIYEGLGAQLKFKVITISPLISGNKMFLESVNLVDIENFVQDLLKNLKLGRG